MVKRFCAESVDEIIDLILETVCTARKTIRIAGDDYPAELVKAKFLKLNSGHIEFIFECLKNNTSKIRNIKKYMLAVLFNAPSTTDIYYTARVAHDMARGTLFGLTAHNDEYEDSDDDDKDNDDSVFDKDDDDEQDCKQGGDDDELDSDERDSGYDWVIDSG